jgi:predicted nucleic acid-binding protein
VSVLLDTPIWSFALRRQRRPLNPVELQVVGRFRELVRQGQARIIGPVRQEVLTGIRDEALFLRLRLALSQFEDITLGTGDFEAAARMTNQCRAVGISGSPVDFLLCAVAISRDLEIFTTDRDFGRYQQVLPLRLHNLAG